MESSAGADFDTFRWHDCSIWAFEFRVGDSSENDWTSDLALDIDYIIEWIPDSGGSARFRVAPAALVFHGVNDPKIDVTWMQSGFQVALRPLSIARVQRKLIPDAKVYLDREYYRYEIDLNSPETGAITFGAVGFSLSLRSDPIISTEQTLSRRARDDLVRGHSSD